MKILVFNVGSSSLKFSVFDMSIQDKGLRRYGFCSTSHKYVGLRVVGELNKPVTDLQIISFHLGNGASVSAIIPVAVSARHLHISPEDAAKMGLKNGDYADVKLKGERGEIAFANTLIRVKEGYITEMHIDPYEANAAGIFYQTKGELVFH